MKKRFVLIAVLLLLALSIAAAFLIPYLTSVSRRSRYAVWYVNDEGAGEQFGYERVSLTTVSGSGDALYAALMHRLMQRPAGQGMHTAFSPDVSLRSAVRRNDSLYVDLSREFSAMSPADSAMARYCTVRTFFGLDGISQIFFLMDGVYLSDYRALSPENYLTGFSQFESETVGVTLYLADGSGRLEARSRSFTCRGYEFLPRVALSYLVENGAGGAVPEGTLVNSVSLYGDCLYLDLSAEFYDALCDDAAAARLAVYSIVDTAASLDGVAEVRLSIENRTPDLAGISLRSALKPDYTLLRSGVR